jgi:hypothetical protein
MSDESEDQSGSALLSRTSNATGASPGGFQRDAFDQSAFDTGANQMMMPANGPLVLREGAGDEPDPAVEREIFEHATAPQEAAAPREITWVNNEGQPLTWASDLAPSRPPGPTGHAGSPAPPTGLNGPAGPIPPSAQEPDSAPRTVQLEARAAARTWGAGGINTAAPATTDEPRFTVSTTILGNLGANTADNLAAAENLLQATGQQLESLKAKGSNDPDVRDLIDFLEWLAKGLSELVDNLRRAVAQPSSDKPIFLGNAAIIAEQLQTGLMQAVEKNRVRIFEIGACVGTACFLSWLSGENIAHLMEVLFGGKK